MYDDAVIDAIDKAKSETELYHIMRTARERTVYEWHEKHDKTWCNVKM